MCPIEKKKSNPVALLPIGVFLVLYLGLGLVFEDVLKIEMGCFPGGSAGGIPAEPGPFFR